MGASQDQLKSHVHRHFEEVLNCGRLEVIEEIYAPSYVLHAPVSTGDTVGFAGLSERVLAFRTGFPDITFTVDDLMAEGDRVAARYTFVGTHSGQFGPLAPTGRSIKRVGDPVRPRRARRADRGLERLRQPGHDASAGCERRLRPPRR